MRTIRRGMAGLVVCALLLGTGCFGNFALTRATHRFNEDVSPNPWVQWATFVGLTVVPVYETTLALDAIFINSAQFWTGRDPLAADTAGSQDMDASQVGSARAPDPTSARRSDPLTADGRADSPVQVP